MSIHRAPRPTTGYTLIRDAVLRDDRLSYRARGVLAAILSRPDNWTTSADQLATEGKEGRDAIRAALSELESVGYIERVQMQDAQGRWATHTIVYDEPQSDLKKGESQTPKTENQPSVNPPSVFQALKKNNREEQPLGPNVGGSVSPLHPGKPRAHPVPAGWKPSDSAHQYADENGIDLDHETEQFLNHHGSKGSTFVDWDRAFRTWLGNAKKWARPSRRSIDEAVPEWMR